MGRLVVSFKAWNKMCSAQSKFKSTCMRSQRTQNLWLNIFHLKPKAKHAWQVLYPPGTKLGNWLFNYTLATLLFFELVQGFKAESFSVLFNLKDLSSRHLDPKPNSFVTRSHKMSLNLKFGNLTYLHVSNLQVMLIILILKSRFYFKKMWMWCVFEGCMCCRRHFEKISFKVLTVHWVVLSLILSNRFKCTNIYQFWHRNISNIGAPEETWNFNISSLLIYFVNVFNPMLSV